MDINAIMTGIIPVSQILQTYLVGLQDELGFEFKKADMIYNRIEDRMYFEIMLPEGTPMNYADKDQFTKYGDIPGDISVWKRYAFSEKEKIKAALLPLLLKLNGEEVKKLEDVDVMVLRYAGSFELIVAMTVNGESKKLNTKIS